jgi:ribosomal protein S18 acetylase RimI-like enzyme
MRSCAGAQLRGSHRPAPTGSVKERWYRRIGDILMLAVDPADQRQGFGRRLTDHATVWLRAFEAVVTNPVARP